MELWDFIKWKLKRRIQIVQEDNWNTLGNSILKSHHGHGKSTVCTNCGDGVPETNEHYLLECSKFDKQREILLKNVKKEIKNLNTVISVKTLLGYYPKIFSSKRKIKKYKNSIENVLTRVMEYISKTKRFNKEMR